MISDLRTFPPRTTPSKRSKSQERERKRKFREKLSADAKEADRENARTGMAEMREREKNEDKNTTKKTRQDCEDEKLYCETEAYAKEIYKKKIGMRKQRENRTKEEQIMENEKAKEGMWRMREAQTQNKKAVDLPDIVERLNEKYRLNKEKSAHESQTEPNYYKGHFKNLQYRN